MTPQDAIALAGAFIASVIAIWAIPSGLLDLRRLSQKPCGNHDFQPRHDMVCVSGHWHNIYVRDVCEHCGATVERASEPASEVAQ